ncbi:MAG: hypothetical protein ACRCT8_10300 [Lacipirellulaceae bacterium]
MTPLDRLDRRFGRYAIENATLWIVASQALVYVFDNLPIGPGGAKADLLRWVALVPSLVLEGQVWRLFTYPATPPMGASHFWFLLYAMAFYYFGSAIESVWGAFRYNVYLLVGYVLTALAAFAAPDAVASSSYVTTSVFLAFAAIAPEATINVWFVLPVKAKWLAALTWVGYAMQFFDGGVVTKMVIGAAVANFFLFFTGNLVRGFKQARRKADFQRRATPTPVRHECRTCGLTSDMAPRTAFRYCSQCAGQCCYCPDHLKNHEHAAARG